MDRVRTLALAVVVVACGARSETPRDVCLEAIKRGPPPATPACDDGSEPRAALEPPSALARVPGPGSGSGPAIAERRWCAGPDNAPRGPYVALERAGRVIESGHYDKDGRLDGPWIVWSGAAPRAVAHYRHGEAIAVEACDLEDLSN